MLENHDIRYVEKQRAIVSTNLQFYTQQNYLKKKNFKGFLRQIKAENSVSGEMFFGKNYEKWPFRQKWRDMPVLECL